MLVEENITNSPSRDFTQNLCEQHKSVTDLVIYTSKNPLNQVLIDCTQELNNPLKPLNTHNSNDCSVDSIPNNHLNNTDELYSYKVGPTLNKHFSNTNELVSPEFNRVNTYLLDEPIEPKSKGLTEDMNRGLLNKSFIHDTVQLTNQVSIDVLDGQIKPNTKPNSSIICTDDYIENKNKNTLNQPLTENKLIPHEQTNTHGLNTSTNPKLSVDGGSDGVYALGNKSSEGVDKSDTYVVGMGDNPLTNKDYSVTFSVAHMFESRYEVIPCEKLVIYTEKSGIVHITVNNKTQSYPLYKCQSM